MSAISWLNRDLWTQVWPNLVASGITATAAVLRIRIHLLRHREALAEMHAQQHEKTLRAIAGLHDRIDRLSAGKES